MLILFTIINVFTLITTKRFLNLINNPIFKSVEQFRESMHDNTNDELIDISSGYERINPNDPDYFYIPVFGSSDIHGHYYPEKYEIGTLNYSKGGLDYLGKYINIIKSEFNNNFIYLDAGDLFQGGTESTETNGTIIVDFFNLMNLSASAFGNHEYDRGRTFIENRLKESKYPYLATNIYDKAKKSKQVFGENHFTSKIYTFKVPNDKKKLFFSEELTEIKVGVVGLTKYMERHQIAGAGFEDVEFLDYKAELVKEVELIRKDEKVKAVLLLSHIGMQCGEKNNLTLNLYKPSDNQELCSKDSDLYKLIDTLEPNLIDGIITGHSHKEVHHWFKEIPIISPVNNGFYANILYLAFNKNKNYQLEKEKVRIEGPVPICERIFSKSIKCEYVKVSEVEKYGELIEYKFHNVKIEAENSLQPIHDKYDSMYKNYTEYICEVIGTDSILTIESNGSFYLGNFMADIQRYITGADISIISYGNLRTDWYPGKIPKFKVKDLQPFGNTFCTIYMNGNEIKKAIKILQKGFKKYYITSGLKQILSKDKNGEYYLSDIKFFDGYKESDLAPDKEYLIVTNSFLVNGGDDFYKVLKWYTPRELKCDNRLDADIIETYLRDQKIIDISKYMDEKNPRIRFIE